MTEQTDPLCISEVTAAALLFDAPWRRFGVVGDSLSAGVGDPTPGYANKGWADRVAKVLRLVRPDVRYLNTSEFGVTTARTVAHQLDSMVDFGPDLLHLPCGPNDIHPGRAYVVPTFPDWHERIRAMNAITGRLGAEYEAVVVDMWDHPFNDRDNLLSEDRIHFSTSGQAVMATEIVRQLAHVLSSRQ